MARPIKDTPTLYGDDSRKFDREVKENENRPVPTEDYNRAMEAYKAIAKPA